MDDGGPKIGGGRGDSTNRLSVLSSIHTNKFFGAMTPLPLPLPSSPPLASGTSVSIFFFFKSQVQCASDKMDDQDTVVTDKDEKTISEDLEKMNIDETDLEPETDDDIFADWVLL